MNIKLIEDSNLKREIAQRILRDLPAWFGIEESTKEYIRNIVKYPFVAAYNNNHAIGFYSLKEENEKVLEMYVLGVLREYHNQGVGTLLQEFVDEYAKAHDYDYLLVLTLAEKAQNREYLITRNFYLKMNFFDFFQNDSIFDKFNPCQIMVKRIHNSQ